MRALIIDDDLVIRTQLKTLLAEYGNYDCDCASRGQIALDAFFAAHEENNPYDLLTVDIELPDINGQQIVNTIREWEASHVDDISSRAKIIMVTVRLEVEEILKSYGEGADAYLTKPITVEQLQEKLNLIKKTK